MIFLVRVKHGARARCHFNDVKICSKWMAWKTTRAYLLHKKPSCASQSSARASAIAEQYSVIVNSVFY